jgi:alanine racemase
MAVSPALFASVLSIDLDAIADNYRALAAKVAPASCGAAVKADGYGLGARPIVRALWAAGCRDFFVAHPTEGLEVRDELPGSRIHILNGPLPDAVDEYLAASLIPVLNSLGDIELWRNMASARGTALAADLHLDTGMCRLGLDLSETEKLVGDAENLLAGIDLQLTMSHLASADDIDSDQSARQLSLFRDATARLGRGTLSFCNSAAIFLGPDYHFEMARPGIALYGCNPTPYADNPMRNPVTLCARMLQIRDVAAGETVGYGATFKATRPMKIATVPIGYADGFHRIGSNTGMTNVDGHPAAVIGRVSMDLITLDVTDVPGPLQRQGTWVEFLGARRTPDDLARDWQTIPYEVLTGLGRRYRREYKGIGA